MASQQLQNLGLALGGFGAGLQGSLPQFQAVQQQGQAQQFEMQQRQQEQKQQMEAERQKTVFTDAAMGLALLDQENYDGLVKLGLNRLQLLQQFPDANPEDTQRLTKLAVAAKNGSEEAKELLRGELESTVQIGQQIGVLKAPAEREGFSLSKDQIRFDANGNEIARGLPSTEDEKLATASTDIGKAKQDLNNGFITPEQYNTLAAKISVPEDAPDKWKDSAELRKEFSGIQTVKEFAQQATAMGRIAASAADPSPAGDLAMIFNYMKVLDPGSTVREGEFANAQNAGDISDRVYGIYNRVIEGERLTPQQRADFMNRGRRLYNDAEAQYSKVFDQYRGIAGRRGLPVEDTLVDYRYYAGQPDGGTATGPKMGEVVDGYKFNGGDPSSPASWEKQ